VILVSHDRRLLDAVCTELWVVEETDSGPSRVARFPGGYGEWRAAAADGWSVATAVQRATAAAADPLGDHPIVPPKSAARSARSAPKPARQVLSKDAYRRRRQVIEDDLTRLGLRKSQLELALGDRAIQSNFVELRRVTSELADVNAALAQAEDAWLVLSEQAPR
jgi:ATPase subunit of ABC transporter with duplicated ATPase domains